MNEDFARSCPIPISQYPQVTLAHGGGGTLTRQLIERMFLKTFDNPALRALHDGAVFPAPGDRLAFSTDSYVVKPLFFPGGDIGQLAIHGTVNDLAMCGARPLYLSAGFILEEGLPMETLWRIVRSMAAAADACGVQIVTGDTKVVNRGKGDGIFINTAGVGVLRDDVHVAPDQVRPGDVLLLNGDVGRHGMAIMAAREELAFDSPITSDSAPLHGLVAALLDARVEVRCLRDLTRGGLASGAIEVAECAGLEIEIDEPRVPVIETVRGACEILGLDPFYVANEGRLLAFVPEAQAEQALSLMRTHPQGGGAAQIGRVRAGEPGLVTLKTALGSNRVLDMLSGEQLPRIC